MIRRKDIIEELKNRGYEVEAHTSIKNGVEVNGIQFMTENGICLVVYTDEIIEESDFLSNAVESVLNTYHNAEIIDFDKENIMNPAFIMENLYIGLQKESSENNIIKKRTDFDGIEKYLYVRINDKLSYKLTCTLFETLNIDEVTVWKVAENNTFSKTEIVSMVDKMAKITGQQIEEISEMIPLMYIIGNEMNFRGASAILDFESLKKFAEKINKHKFYALPNSINEIILIPDDGTQDIEELNTMVREVNKMQVDEMERLTDRAYVIEV